LTIKYHALGPDGLGAKFIFPRLVDGVPFIGPADRVVRFVGMGLNVQFINYYLKTPSSGKVMIRIATPYGEEVAALEGKTAIGLNSVVWDMRRAQPQGAQPAGRGGGPAGRVMANRVLPGEYVVTLEVGDKKWTARTSLPGMPIRD